jgi:hypothetical protein
MFVVYKHRGNGGLMKTHKARRLDNGEWIEGTYTLVANTYHTIFIGEEFSDGWEEINIKTLEEIK